MTDLPFTLADAARILKLETDRTTTWQELMVDRGWHDQAECLDSSPQLFYPERGETTFSIKPICARCPVRLDCLAFAINNGERHGIWGGLGERARRRIRVENAA